MTTITAKMHFDLDLFQAETGGLRWVREEKVEVASETLRTRTSQQLHRTVAMYPTDTQLREYKAYACQRDPAVLVQDN